MQATGDDYIFVDNFDLSITCPESLCVALCRRHSGVGADGLVLMEPSAVADAKMRIFNRDGSEGQMAGNCIRCVAKYLFDSGKAPRTDLSIETASGVKQVRVYTRNGRVTLAEVAMGPVDFAAAALPCTLPEQELIDYPLTVGDQTWQVTCLSVGNPHCVVFCDTIHQLDLQTLGPRFENAPVFPQRINTEFVRVVGPATLAMRVYERGNGETPACGTGACAAVAAAVRLGYCAKNTDVTVKVPGGDLIVRCTDEGVTLTGEARLVYQGQTTY